MYLTTVFLFILILFLNLLNGLSLSRKFHNISVPVAEVERLWLRFQQLGTNDGGVITNEVLQTPLFADNPCLRQVTVLKYFI